MNGLKAASSHFGASSATDEFLAELEDQAFATVALPTASLKHAVERFSGRTPAVTVAGASLQERATRTVAHILAEAMGPVQDAPAEGIVEGLMRYCAARIAKSSKSKHVRKLASSLGPHDAPSAEELADLVAIANGELLATSIYGGENGGAHGGYLRERFVAMVAEKHGAAALLSMASVRSDSLEAAAEEVFQRPLAILTHEFREYLANERDSHASIRVFMKRAIVYSSGNKLLWSALLATLAMQVAYAIAVPLSMNHLIDAGLTADTPRYIETILALLVGLFLLNTVAGIGQDFLTAQIGAKVMLRLRRLTYAKMLSLDAASTSRMKSGGFLSRFSSDMGIVEHAIARAIPSTVKGIVGASLNVGLLFWVEWKLALITFAVLPLTVILPKLATGKAARFNASRQKVESRLIGSVQETVDLFRIIRAFSLAGNQRDRFETAARELSTASRRSSAWRSVAGRLTDVGVGLVTLTVICVGTILAYHNDLTTGEFAAFIGLLVNFGSYMGTLGERVPDLIEGSTSMGRIDEVLEEHEDDRTDSGVTVSFQDKLTAKDVYFSYDGQRTNIGGVSLEIPAGSSAAFVGDSGSGKSTMINLFMRFYEPDLGSITLDGVPLETIDLTCLRDQMALVPQECLLFDASVRENIRMGRLDATEEEIEAAAKAADAHDLIMGLPGGYDAAVGSLGGNLSGGQRQRIAIARALVRDPKILILDEATSALDAGTAAAIDETVNRLAKSRTVISITHHLKPVSHFDCIYVVRDGRIIEHGSHQDLMAANGHYRMLWERQHASDDEADVMSSVA